MAKPYVIENEVGNELAAEFVHGTDTEMTLSSAAEFDSGGGYVRVYVNAIGGAWALYEYTSIAGAVLTVTPCTLGDVESAASYTFPIGSPVERVWVAEDVADLRADHVDTGDPRLSDARTPSAHKDSHDPEDGSDKLDTAAAAEISVVTAAGVGTSHSLSRADHVHAINHGIADNHLLTVDSADAATGEYAKFTANGIESKSVSEVRADLKVTNIHYLRGCVPSPKDYYDNVDHEICLWPATDGAITITKIQITCDADPTTELDIDLKWADAFIGFASAAVIDVCDTTAGVVLITSGFDDATVPSGKCLYWLFGAAPDAAITQFSFTIEYTYD